MGSLAALLSGCQMTGAQSSPQGPALDRLLSCQLVAAVVWDSDCGARRRRSRYDVCLKTHPSQNSKANGHS